MSSSVLRFYSEDPLEGPRWLGIDQSLTGFAACLLDSHGNYEIGVFRSEKRGASRLKEIYEWLDDLLRESPEDVAMEGTVNLSASASVLGELAGIVKLCLIQQGYHPIVVPPMTLKKFVVGNAKNSAKSQMLLAVYKRYGVELSNDNAADAYGLARIARGECLNAVEIAVMKKLSDPKFREQ